MAIHGEQREGTLILGAPRSGTTLLRRLINAHPDLACPGETNLFTACARFLHSELIAEDVDISVLSGLSFAGFDDEQVLHRLREFSFQFLRDYATAQKKPRWVEKTAFNSFFVDEIEQLCGNSVHYVCILRHALDVACSIKELCDVNGTYLDELHAYVQLNPNPLEAFAEAWVDVTNDLLALAERRPEDTVVIRYEDLVREPHETMTAVCESLGTEWSQEMLDAALGDRTQAGLGDWKTYGKSRMDPASIKRWKGLSTSTVSHLARIVNPTLEAAGYEPVAIDHPESDSEEARRRYELSLMLQGMRKSDE